MMRILIVLGLAGAVIVMMTGVTTPWVLSGSTHSSIPASEMQIDEFARIPVVHNGRLKPMDTIARTHLRAVSNRETFKDEKGASRPAIEWLLHVETDLFASKGGPAQKDKVFRIDHPQLLNALGLEAREGYRYAIEEFLPRLRDLDEVLKGAHERKEKGQPIDEYETQVLEFERRVGIYDRLSRLQLPHLIPPRDKGEWRTLQEAAPKSETPDGNDPDVDAWRLMLLAYSNQNATKFNEAVNAYLHRLEQDRPNDVKRALIETRYNHLDLLNWCKWLYLLAFVMTFVGYLVRQDELSLGTWLLILALFVVHTFALGSRIYLSGRPPVTNLYSSAVFIGWGAVALGLFLERIFRMGVGNIVASTAGFATLLIAYILSVDGDTMEVLQAVLDTQFWLATHVTCITLGYATTYVAGLLGLIFIVRGVFTRSLSDEVARALTRMTYGVTCFAMFFSFVGTVLGGLWADDSWGRFWGWDPKENGALMIVLWNALVLHARWGGLVRERGMAVLAVLGNIVVSWSWFGVNQLGVGLHSYGFTSGVTVALGVFAVSQAVIAGLGLLPQDLWTSKPAAKGASAKRESADA